MVKLPLHNSYQEKTMYYQQIESDSFFTYFIPTFKFLFENFSSSVAFWFFVFMFTIFVFIFGNVISDFFFSSVKKVKLKKISYIFSLTLSFLIFISTACWVINSDYKKEIALDSYDSKTMYTFKMITSKHFEQDFAPLLIKYQNLSKDTNHFSHTFQKFITANPKYENLSLEDVISFIRKYNNHYVYFYSNEDKELIHYFVFRAFEKKKMKRYLYKGFFYIIDELDEKYKREKIKLENKKMATQDALKHKEYRNKIIDFEKWNNYKLEDKLKNN